MPAPSGASPTCLKKFPARRPTSATDPAPRPRRPLTCGPSPAPRSAISRRPSRSASGTRARNAIAGTASGGTTSPARERRSIPTEAVGVADARGRTKETLMMTTDYPTVASPSPTISRLRLGLILICTLLGLNVMAGKADASLNVESFSTASSNHEAGGHPDLSTSFRLSEPGVSEAARNVIFQAPEGIFGNPYAITHCTSSDFATDQCPSDSQAGLITVYSNYEGETHKLLGTAPLFNIEPLGEQTALLAFNVPTLNIPINIPVVVRTSSDYGLTFTVQEISQSTPLAGADLTIWGFPAIDAHNGERFPKGSLGKPSNCPGLADTSCIKGPTAAGIPARPLTDNPTTCAGPLVTKLTVQTYQDPENPTPVEGTYPATTNCDLEVFNPVLYASPTTTATDSASGLNLELSAPQFLGFANSPSEVRSATVTLPPGFTINPDAADGQTACSDELANFDSEAPAECPDSSKIGTFAIGTQALPGTLDGSVYI